jgi:hypothetical protein
MLAKSLRLTKPRGTAPANTCATTFTRTQLKASSQFSNAARGIYQHCSEKHLHRYLAEFDFRYNYRASLGYNDKDRTIAAVRGGEGKRLTYRQPRQVGI